MDVSLSLFIKIAFFFGVLATRVDRYRAPHPASSSVGGMRLGSEAARIGNLWQCGLGHPVVKDTIKRGFGSEGNSENRTSVTSVRHAPFQGLRCRSLTTDDMVRLRVVASRWNVGNRFAEMGERAYEKA